MSDADLFTDEPAPAGDLFTDEPAPKSLGGFVENAVNNAGRAINPVNIVKGLGSTLKEGLYDIPKVAGESSIDLLRGTAKAATTGELPDIEDVKKSPLLEKTRQMTEPIAKDPLGYAYKNPVDAAGLLLAGAGMVKPFLGAAAEAPAMEAAGIPKAMESEIPKATEPAEAIPMGAKEPVSEAPSTLPPDPNAPPPKAAPIAKADPLAEVRDWIAKQGKKVEDVPGWQEKAAKYVKNEVADLRAKDIGMRDPMIRSLDPKRPLEALKKAEDLMTYAGDNGYFKPGLTNVARKDAIASKISETGKNIGAVREIGGQRAAPPIADIRNTIKNELTTEYGQKAGREIKTVLSDFDRKVKANPSFQGLSDVATYLNGEKHTFNKIGQNPGPTTDAANIISRMNNESLRKVLSPEEDKFYTQNLRDFGAHKKLESMVASAARRGMTGRGAPGGPLAALWQQLWDRGGYRMAGNVADRMSTSVLKNPGKIKTLPQFFEELGHHAGEEIGDTIEGMYKGGMIPDDVRAYVGTKGC